MALDPASLPDDVAALKRMIVGMAQDAVQANTLIEKLRFELARLKRSQFGTSSEKLGSRIEQLELAIEAWKVDEAERRAAAPVVAEAVEAASPKPARRPLPYHLPRETVMYPGPCACPSCGGRLRRIGEGVTEMLAAFGQRFPGIQISVSIGNSLEVQRALLAYETEVAVLGHTDPDDRLLTIPYRQHPVLIFTNQGHRFAGRPAISLRKLEGERVIARERGSTTRRAIEAALRQEGVTVDATIEIGSRESIREAVIRGLGIGYVSEAEYIPDHALRSLRISDADIFTVAQVVVLRDRQNSRMIRAFTDVVAAIPGD